MTATTDNRFLVPAWGASLAIHGVVVVLATLFAAQVRPVLQEEPFKWDVALVESSKLDPAAEAAAVSGAAPPEPVVQPVPSPVPAVAPRPVEPPSETVTHRVAPRQAVQMVHPEPPRPVQRREEPPTIPQIEAPPPVTKPLHEKPIEPVEQQIVEAAKSETVTVKEPEPLQTAEPMMAERQAAAAPASEPSVSRPEPTVSRPVDTPAAPSVSEPVASSTHAESAPPVASLPNPAAHEAPIQTAKAGAPGPEVKTDHRWLAESLWRRVAELKRYPSSARLNGQEGKVVLKAVIRSDGHLIEVTVQKSSGHQILDAAAIEAVKLACPLHMKHAINKPEIVVSLPIVYSLAN
jgi:protein TonB